MRQNDSSSI